MKKYGALLLLVLGVLTLLLPWLLAPNAETFTVDAMPGFYFFEGNIGGLMLLLLIFSTNIMWLKSVDRRALLLLESALVFLLALLLAPIFCGVGRKHGLSNP